MEERYRTVMDTLNRLTKREEEKRDISKIVICVLIVLAVLVAIGGTAYAIWRMMSKDDLDDFEDEFEDDFEDEFFEDDGEEKKEEPASDEEKKAEE